MSTIQKIAVWFTSVGGALIMLGAFVTWAWGVHNDFLMEQLSPVLRWTYSQRINNYRRMECMGELTDITRDALEVAHADYENLVGRRISERSCDSL